MAKLAIIPARGGSKRLPRKNILPFLGKPILAYTIEAAAEAGIFDAVVVSTEDAEIAELARRYGAEVDLRPQSLAEDQATVADVCVELLARKPLPWGDVQQMCVLYATAPLRNANDIREVMALLEPGVCDFGIAATQYTHYPYQALRYGEGGELSPMWPDLCHRSSAEIGPLIAGNGSTYAVNVSAFLEHKAFYGPGMRAHMMPFSRSVDIDTADDFDLALCLARGAIGS